MHLSCVTLGKLLNLSVPLFLHMWNADDNRICQVELLQGLIELGYIKCLEKYLASSKPYISMLALLLLLIIIAFMDLRRSSF